MAPRYVPSDVGALGEDADVVAVISWTNACARRLERHGLQTPLPGIAAATAAMCGAHAQIMSAAEVSIGLRVVGVTRADVAKALWDERSIVKTFGPRGTVHLLPAAELASWCVALSAVPRASSMPLPIKLDETQTDAVVAAIDDALAGAELTVDELDAAVGERCGAWAAELVMPAFGGFWPRWRQAIATAAMRGALCFGPNRGRRVTYTSPRRWLPYCTPRADALPRLVHDYLHAYGPATPAHFAQWLAAPTAWARTLFAALSLDEVELGGAPAWVNAGDTEFGEPARGLRLLPYFDAFAVGSHPRCLLFPARASERALAGSQAGNFPVLLIDGEVAGVWHQRRSGKRIAVTVEPLTPLAAKHRRALDDEVDKIGMILQGRAELSVGPVTVGPHA
jgi:Winged helix DNA-binding domain